MGARSIFVVEDVVLIRMMVCDMLEELGHKVVAEAGALKPAIEITRSANFDLAILDVNLGQQTSELVAEIIRRRGLPFFFLTGHGAAGLPGAFRNAPRLEKPVLCSALAKGSNAAQGLDTRRGRRSSWWLRRLSATNGR